MDVLRSVSRWLASFCYLCFFLSLSLLSSCAQAASPPPVELVDVYQGQVNLAHYLGERKI